MEPHHIIAVTSHTAADLSSVLSETFTFYDMQSAKILGCYLYKIKVLF